jgi:hypothetical protein
MFDPLDNHYITVLKMAEVDTTVRRLLDQWKECPDITYEQFLEAVMVKLVEDKTALMKGVMDMVKAKGLNEIDDND